MTRLGLLLHSYDAEVAVAAEAAGFDSLWVRDSALHDETLLCALAAVTATARLGAVTDVTFRNPAVIAKQATTLDLLSGGRAVVALGAEEAGRLEEAVIVARQVFRDTSPTFAGRHFCADGALNHPAPAQDGGPPVLVHGHIGVAARHADGVVLDCTPAALRSELASLARVCGESDRGLSTLMTVWLAPSAGTPAAIAEAAGAGGINEVVLDVGAATPDAVVVAAQEVRKARRHGR